MKLLLKRIEKTLSYTIGNLYIDGAYFCDTLENKDRDLTQDMDVSTIKKLKISGKTAIPVGTYNMSLDIVSSKYSSSAFMKQYANGARVPRLLDVPGFEGILIHTGNTSADTNGCILVGKNNVLGQVTKSKDTFKELYPILQTGENISITIE